MNSPILKLSNATNSRLAGFRRLFGPTRIHARETCPSVQRIMKSEGLICSFGGQLVVSSRPLYHTLLEDERKVIQFEVRAERTSYI
jgi:hypothetical protein